MARLIAAAIGLIGIASSAFAQTPAARAAIPSNQAADSPEKLLSPSSQLYIRWDGIAAHNDAYKKSFWGGLMAGPTGGSIRTLLAEWPKLLGSSLLTQPLLEGKPPEELKKNLADLKNASAIVDLIVDKGLVIGIEVREPTLTVKGVGQALGTLFNGELPGSEMLAPSVQLLLVVPDAAERAEVILAATRLVLTAEAKTRLEPFEIAGRKGFAITPEEAEPRGSRFTACWTEGKHVVFYTGTAKLEDTITGMEANAKKGGITGHPLFQKCKKDPGYESVTRGFVDTGRMIAMAKKLAGPFVPGLGQRLQDLGISNLKSITFNSGFEGKESRATYEFELPGERKGFAKIFKQEPLGLKDLPPLPPDVSRFSALRIDPTAAYESAIAVFETLMSNDSIGAEEDDGTSMEEKIRLRREALMKELDKALGVNFKSEFLAHLSDKFVISNSPSEGLSSLGTIACISLKDPAKFKMAMDRIQRRMETLVGAPVKVRKKMLCGVEIRELYSKTFQIFTPTYAIAGDWLVFSLHPQPVQGFILRGKGEIPSWKPDAATAARIAKLPADACSLQFCDPRATVQNLCCVAPLGLNTLNTLLNNSRSDNESTYDPFDIGLLPNSHELCKHLFPNLTVIRNDAASIRIEVNESFSLPLEFLGVETVAASSYFVPALAFFLGSKGK
jgi:hypothetical protein